MKLRSEVWRAGFQLSPTMTAQASHHLQLLSVKPIAETEGLFMSQLSSLNVPLSSSCVSSKDASSPSMTSSHSSKETILISSDHNHILTRLKQQRADLHKHFASPKWKAESLPISGLPPQLEKRKAETQPTPLHFIQGQKRLRFRNVSSDDAHARYARGYANQDVNTVPSCTARGNNNGIGERVANALRFRVLTDKASDSGDERQRIVPALQSFPISQPVRDNARLTSKSPRTLPPGASPDGPWKHRPHDAVPIPISRPGSPRLPQVLPLESRELEIRLSLDPLRNRLFEIPRSTYGGETGTESLSGWNINPPPCPPSLGKQRNINQFRRLRSLSCPARPCNAAHELSRQIQPVVGPVRAVGIVEHVLTLAEDPDNHKHQNHIANHGSYEPEFFSATETRNYGRTDSPCARFFAHKRRSGTRTTSPSSPRLPFDTREIHLHNSNAQPSSTLSKIIHASNTHSSIALSDIIPTSTIQSPSTLSDIYTTNIPPPRPLSDIVQSNMAHRQSPQWVGDPRQQTTGSNYPVPAGNPQQQLLNVHNPFMQNAPQGYEQRGYYEQRGSQSQVPNQFQLPYGAQMVYHSPSNYNAQSFNHYSTAYHPQMAQQSPQFHPQQLLQHMDYTGLIGNRGYMATQPEDLHSGYQGYHPSPIHQHLQNASPTIHPSLLQQQQFQSGAQGLHPSRPQAGIQNILVSTNSVATNVLTTPLQGLYEDGYPLTYTNIRPQNGTGSSAWSPIIIEDETDQYQDGSGSDPSGPTVNLRAQTASPTIIRTVSPSPAPAPPVLKVPSPPPLPMYKLKDEFVITASTIENKTAETKVRVFRGKDGSTHNDFETWYHHERGTGNLAPCQVLLVEGGVHKAFKEKAEKAWVLLAKYKNSLDEAERQRVQNTEREKATEEAEEANRVAKAKADQEKKDAKNTKQREDRKRKKDRKDAEEEVARGKAARKAAAEAAAGRKKIAAEKAVADELAAEKRADEEKREAENKIRAQKFEAARDGQRKKREGMKLASQQRQSKTAVRSDATSEGHDHDTESSPDGLQAVSTGDRMETDTEDTGYDTSDENPDRDREHDHLFWDTKPKKNKKPDHETMQDNSSEPTPMEGVVTTTDAQEESAEATTTEGAAGSQTDEPVGQLAHIPSDTVEQDTYNFAVELWETISEKSGSGDSDYSKGSDQMEEDEVKLLNENAEESEGSEEEGSGSEEGVVEEVAEESEESEAE